MKKDLRNITVGELKELLKGIDDSVEIDVWDNLGLVETLEIEVLEWEHETTVDINIDGTYPYY